MRLFFTPGQFLMMIVLLPLLASAALFRINLKPIARKLPVRHCHQRPPPVRNSFPMVSNVEHWERILGSDPKYAFVPAHVHSYKGISGCMFITPNGAVEEVGRDSNVISWSIKEEGDLGGSIESKPDAKFNFVAGPNYKWVLRRQLGELLFIDEDVLSRGPIDLMDGDKVYLFPRWIKFPLIHELVIDQPSYFALNRLLVDGREFLRYFGRENPSADFIAALTFTKLE